MTTSVASIFQTMSYSESSNGENAYRDWLSSGSKESCVAFLKNAFQSGNNYDSSTDPLCLQESRKVIGEALWSDQTSRANLLFQLAQTVEKKNELFACVESGTTQKTLNRTRERDVPQLVRHLFDAAFAVARCPEGWIPHGIVGIIGEETNSPSLCQSWPLGPALAAGNAVVLCASSHNCHSAFLLAESARDAGFPPGVLSVACCVPDFLINSFDLVLGSGSKPIPKLTSNLKWRPTARPKAIVTESADLASAAHGIIQLAYYNAPMSPSSGACVLVQECVLSTFWAEISDQFKRLVPYSTLWNKTGDYYFHFEDAALAAKRDENIRAAQEHGAQLIFPSTQSQSSCGPILIRDIEPTAPLLQETESPAGCQIVWVQSFRHIKEAVSLANGSPFTDCVSVWGEKTTEILELAKDLRAPNVWVNTQNITDATNGLDVKDLLCKTEAYLNKSLPSPLPHQATDRLQFGKSVQSAVSLAKSSFKKWNELGAESRLKLLFTLPGKFLSKEESLRKTLSISAETLSKQTRQMFKYLIQASIPGPTTKSAEVSGTKDWSWTSPCGVVGVLLPKDGTFPALVVSLGAALTAGNTVVAVCHDKALVEICKQVIADSGIPNGVVNFLNSEDPSEVPGELLLETNIDVAWILTGQFNLYVNRPDLTVGTLPISLLNLSNYDWEKNISEAPLTEWFQKKATSLKKVWFQSGSEL